MKQTKQERERMKKQKSLIEALSEDDSLEELEEDEIKAKKNKAKKALKIELRKNPDKLIEFIFTMRNQIVSLKKELSAHIQEPYGSILVKEKDGSWGAWTGTFRINDIKKISALKEQIIEHFNFHFKQDKDKEFLLVINTSENETITELLEGKVK